MKVVSNIPLHVGRPNIGDRELFLQTINEILDRRCFSNNGPVVQQFETLVAETVGVKHAVAVCNATMGIEIAIRALGLNGEVIIPSFTFIATAHALEWQGIKPVFCDINPEDHNINAQRIESLISDKTTGIMGVHLWGNACDTNAIDEIASKYKLKVLYDASHSFGCSKNGKMIGSFGECEIFSFHATKFINCLEGGVITTNNDDLAYKMRVMINFGFSGLDKVDCLGINGKMNEISAAMGITNLKSMEAIIRINCENYNHYKNNLREISGISVFEHSPNEKNNYQYVVIEIDSEVCGCKRDDILNALHKSNIMARKYFWPGCHKMEPYKSNQIYSGAMLKETDRISERVIILPTGQSVDSNAINRICEIIKKTVTH